MALAIFDVSRGGITLTDLLEMDLDEATDWLEDAIAYARAKNKAASGGRG